MGLGAQALGLPAPWLLGGLVGGLIAAAGGSGRIAVPRPVTLASHALVGVTLGAQVQPSALAGLADNGVVVLAVVLLTLGLSVAVALVLTRVARVDRVTATIGMLPGAAPALIAVGDEVGADGRLVATMQFGRVLLVVMSVPVLALLLGAAPGGEPGGAPLEGAAGGGESLGAVLVAAGTAATGPLLAVLAHAPVGTLVGPLVLAALVSGTGAAAVAVPGPVADVAFALVGLGVGLRFDRTSLRHAGRLIPAVAAAVVALVLACAALGGLLLEALDTDPLTAYLATTPGGISAVLAAAFDSGADVTVVVAVQTLRLVLLAALAPFLVHALRRRSAA